LDLGALSVAALQASSIEQALATHHGKLISGLRLGCATLAQLHTARPSCSWGLCAAARSGFSFASRTAGRGTGVLASARVKV
jgi:hypothetical protein